ncbi:HAMP domain-containing histidine kinase, partial [bacterium]|nr:HAMP domain-containing histidine kinase [bacterium]
DKNVNLLNVTTQEIQMILSSEIEFTRNMLRDVPTHKVIDEIFSQLQGLAADKFVVLNQDFNKFHIHVKAIPQQIKVVLKNIIQNAIKYSFSGYEKKLIPVNIHYQEEGELLIILVENFGCQITQEEIDNRKIFQLGYRGKKDFKNRSGTGTGLYFAEKIINKHGGKILVESKPQGTPKEEQYQKYHTIFKIYWPWCYEIEKKQGREKWGRW